MKGLELSKQFYEEYGVPMLSEFAEVAPKIAVALAGSGSECFGYDDAQSQDHDFEPGFCLFLPDEDTVDRRTAFLLERAYAKLPREFMGYTRQPLSPVGGNRHGVIRLGEFLTEKTGCADGILTTDEWFMVPEQSLAEVTNGLVFRDDSDLFGAVRRRLAYLPSDVRKKKLAGHLLLMGQAGQYNFPRLIGRGDTAAAQLAVYEFVKSALHAVFLLNGAYLPYYKWQFRALRDLPHLTNLADPLAQLMCTDNGTENAKMKSDIIEEMAAAIIGAMQERGLTNFGGTELEGHAYAVNDTVEDGNLRNQHILYGV
ncbi:MAG: DUF4037 domain-containing protein [Ruminococcaceae bacterium]|nr:DUF4037 domain-containing protein [Oscillospiraceae bacterium]